MSTPQPWGLRIDAPFRVEPFNDLAQYPVETTRFHPTFLYESLWNVAVLYGLLLIERRVRRLRRGDLVLCYAILYSIGRLVIESLRTDSLCTNGIGGSCEGALRTAQVVAIVTIVGCGAVLALRQLRRPRSPQPVT